MEPDPGFAERQDLPPGGYVVSEASEADMLASGMDPLLVASIVADRRVREAEQAVRDTA